ncbi:helix-turn-helix transcriptional regulator [Paraburkholderia bannensis]|uniref:helix-turn-helix transcriptional regulator n=1 Tax=Paraburkholderia bannensis TaxID=765414 RepID=UPI002ABE0FDA|nr:AlpA family transcriptional regulator [Paraburkholderia bannensis]
MESPIQILRLPDVEKRLGMSRPTIYRWLQKDPCFPRPVKLGSHSVGWVESEINAWLGARIQSRSR